MSEGKFVFAQVMDHVPLSTFHRCVARYSGEHIRYNERSGAERVNGALKDSYGGRTVRVRGAPKVFCHLMFGILAQTVEQLMRLIQ